MKTRNDQQLTQYVIPDGEGLTALPISFFTVIARRVDTCMICQANHMHTCPGGQCQGVQVRPDVAIALCRTLRGFAPIGARNDELHEVIYDH
jgi:hypothetical protein